MKLTTKLKEELILEGLKENAMKYRSMCDMLFASNQSKVRCQERINMIMQLIDEIRNRGVII